MSYEPAESSASPFSPGLPALYAVAFLSGISLGLFNPFISAFMSQNNAGNILIGLNSTLYFFVIAVGTPIVAAGIRKLGLRQVMMLGFAIMALIPPLFPLSAEPSLWFLIRAVMGLGVCFYLISGQTAINFFCNDGNRAIANGLDALFFSLGFGIGPVLGGFFYKTSPEIAFSVGSIFMLGGILVVFFGLPEKNIRFQPIKFGLFKQLSLPLQGAFAYGFSVSTLVSLYPSYLLQNSHDVEKIGFVFSVFMAGGLLATVPVTRLADRMSKYKVLAACTAVALVALLGMPFTENSTLILILAFIAGVGMTPIFPLSLALITSKLSVEDLPSGSALFTSAYSAGCTAGPILSATIMALLGDGYIFSLMLLFFIVFAGLLFRPAMSKTV